jgi:hypothetical protein
MAARLLALLILAVPALTVDAAQIQVGFRPQNGDVGTATEWAMEMISDTPIGSTGIFVACTTFPCEFTHWSTDPVIGLPGVNATIHAVYDSTAGWGFFQVDWLPPYIGMTINLGPGFLAPDLGPVDTWLGLGMLHGLAAADILAGEGMETGLWADAAGNHIPASDVAYTFPEPRALMLLGLGLCTLALLRYPAR